jgi:hypothetical protein
MDEKTNASLNQLLLALRAFSRSVEKSFHHGMYEGTTDLMIRQYRTLHDKAAQLLLDDFYVNECLVLDVSPEASDEQKVSQVMLLSDQLTDYLQNTLKSEQQTHAATGAHEINDIGREFQEQVMNLTRHTLKRALSHIDVEVNVSDEPEEPIESESNTED